MREAIIALSFVPGSLTNTVLRIITAGLFRGMMSFLLENILMTLNVNIGSPSSEIITAPSSDVSEIVRHSQLSVNLYVLAANSYIRH